MYKWGLAIHPSWTAEIVSAWSFLFLSFFDFTQFLNESAVSAVSSR